MDWLHPALEVVEILAIAVLAWSVGVAFNRLRIHSEVFVRIPDLISQLAVKENTKIDELLVTQAVMIHRLEEIERRLPNAPR